MAALPSCASSRQTNPLQGAALSKHQLHTATCYEERPEEKPQPSCTSWDVAAQRENEQRGQSPLKLSFSLQSSKRDFGGQKHLGRKELPALHPLPSPGAQQIKGSGQGKLALSLDGVMAWPSEGSAQINVSWPPEAVLPGGYPQGSVGQQG